MVSSLASQTFVPYSSLPSVSDLYLIGQRSKVTQLLFPLQNPYSQDPPINVLYFFSANIFTVILCDDANQTLKPGYSGDPFFNVCPMIFWQDPLTRCSTELLQAIRECGDQIAGFPKMKALQVECRSEVKPAPADLHREIARLICGEIAFLEIDAYKITVIPNTWSTSSARAHWKGLTYVQTNQLVKVWFHEKNPEAFTSAQAALRKELLETIAKIKQLNPRFQAAFTRGALPQIEKLYTEMEEHLNNFDAKLSELEQLKPEHISSAVKSTFQAQLSVKIDQNNAVLEAIKEDILTKSTHELMQTLSKTCLENVDLKADCRLLVTLIQQYTNHINNVIAHLIQLQTNRSAQSFGNWGENARTFQRRCSNFCLTFSAWLTSRNIINPSEEMRLTELKKWKEHLWMTLEYVANFLVGAKLDLSIFDDNTFFTPYCKLKEETLNFLKKVIKETASLSPQDKAERLQETETQQNSLNELKQVMRTPKPFGLFKRFTQGGHFIYGINDLPPANSLANPDPNNRLDEVHLIGND